MSIGKRKATNKSDLESFNWPNLKMRKREEAVSAFHSFLESYETAKLNHEVNFFTQKLTIMLQRIATGMTFRRRYKEPVYRYLLIVVKEAMLTEVEVALWSLVISATEPNSTHLDFFLFIRMSALATKQLAEEEIACEQLVEFLNGKPGFKQEYESWHQASAPRLTFSLIDINEAYQHLVQTVTSEEKRESPYGFLIDELTEEPALHSEVQKSFGQISALAQLEQETNIMLPLPNPLSESRSPSMEKHPSYFLNSSDSFEKQFQESKKIVPGD